MSKQYERYKDSAIEWLGEIPKHWDKSILKYEAESVLGKMLTPEDKGGYKLKPYLKSKNIGWGKLKLKSVDEMWFSEKELKTYRVKKGDLLVSEGGEIGKTSMWNNELEECYIQNSVHKITIHQKNHPRYFFYYFQFLGKVGYFWNIVSQVSIAHLTKEKLVKSPCLVPPYEEQAAMADYLDYKTGQIDELIAQKEHLMDLLQKKRQSIINEAVTQGLNPNAPRKDSSIEWLGEIPAHWEVWKVSRAFSIIGSGTTPQSGADIYYENGSINWVNTGDLNDGLLLSCEKKITEKAFEDHSALKVYPAGTILIAMYGATIGKTSLLGIQACTNQACCALTDSKIVDNKYAFYWFLAHKDLIVSMGYGGGQPNISQNTIRSLKICRPPEDEQAEIVKFLDNSTSKITDVLSQIDFQISQLKSYRQSIISEVVTGKVDVRGAVLN